MQANIKDQLTTDMKEAMRSKDAERLGVIRLILAAIKQREIDDRIVLNESEIISLMEKMLKQRRESIKQYEMAQRDELVLKEQQEIRIIQQYLPTPLSQTELNDLVQSTISDLGATVPADMSKVMRALKTKVQGRADMAILSQQVQSILSAGK